MKRLDPFSDRMSRDIRNALSSALVTELCGEQDRYVDTVAGRWLDDVGEEPYRSYIEQSRVRYGRVLDHIRKRQIRGTRNHAVVLWNFGLFFEMHELLETIWLGSSGKERDALKGLIQAAGAYVHLLRGKPVPARKLAHRARKNIRKAKEYLSFIGNLDQLLHCLEQLADPPPKLLHG
ncbi:MAG: DUF309 domain-containing protein [Desulfobacteraceae bacterium]|jgi:hypothetical protein